MSGSRVSVLLVVALTGACLDEVTQYCAAVDLVCPRSTVCTPRGCLPPALLAACAGQDAGALCDLASGVRGRCADDGVCTARVCGDGVVDTDLLEQCDDGRNHRLRDGCTDLCAAERPAWTTINPPYLVRGGLPVATYDSFRRRVVALSDSLGGLVEFDGRVWHAPPTDPPRLLRHTLAYDPLRRRVVAFGGTLFDQDGGSTMSDRTWEYDGRRWEERVLPVRPAARLGAVMAFDPDRGQVVLFGGNSDGGLLADVWTYDGVGWTELSTTGTPPPVTANGRVLVHDPRGHRLVLIGGLAVDDAWALVGARWQPLPAVGLPARVAAVEPSSGRVVAFGSVDSLGPMQGAALVGDAWERLQDGPAGYGVIAGTLTPTPTGDLLCLDGLGGPTWRYRAGAWAELDATPEFGRPASAFDEARARLVTVLANPGGRLETWELVEGVFTRVGVQDLGGLGRPALTFDRRRQRLLLVGGASGREVWTWSEAGWQVLPVTGAPPAGQTWTGTYDPTGDRLVLVGAGTGDRAQTWALSGAGVWSELGGAEAPPSGDASLIFDERGDRLLLYAPTSRTEPDLRSELWELRGTTWRRLVVPLAAPAQPAEGFVFHRSLGRAVLVQTAFPPQPLWAGPRNLWVFDGLAWQPEFVDDAPAPRSGATYTFDPLSQGVAVIGAPLDVDLLRWRDTATLDERCDGVTDLDQDGLAGCADPDCWGWCAPACEPGASCASASCGDGVCTAEREDPWRCPVDCDPAPAACGDGVCSARDETLAGCPADCAVCADGVCSAAEACPVDC
ncbi:MAG: DUF4215 domain-containing protein [Kofleriaceae bacterium]|nr:DUF4215 domain-containing protein [Kofleriaceae bacterium]MBP9205635.1 DUF4215 domain-containing protein [Kofleriaceae bacterium]